MNKLSTLLATALTLVLPLSLNAQEFVWKADLQVQFDNREYKSEFNWPQTLFGAKLTPEVGVGWDEGRSSIMIGATAIEEFGAKSLDIDPELILYYQYDTEKYNISAGRIPRTQVMGEYPTAFFSDSVKFFDANIDGLLLQWMGRLGYIEFACDWDSRQSKTKREKFTLFSSGRINYRLFYAGYYMTMHHHAGTAAEENEGGNVTDNVWASCFLGVDLDGKTIFDRLSLQVGSLQSFQNDRTHVGKYVKPSGAMIDARIEKFGFGIFNSLYLGDNQMPYFDRYGSSLYWGDPFYRTTNDIYNRLEIYWSPRLKKNMELKVASIHHYDGKKTGWQQWISFRVHIGSRMFKKTAE